MPNRKSRRGAGAAADEHHQTVEDHDSSDGHSGAPSEPGTHSDPVDTTTDSAIESLQQKLQEKEQEARRWQEDYLRALADMQNMRKRLQQDAEDARAYANADLVKQWLPILDNFELAIRHAEADRNFEGLATGVQQIFKQMRETLQKVGVEPIQAVGQPFDPETHEAIGHVSSDEFQEGVVAEDVRTGYKMRGRLIRPSLVRVSG